MKYSDLEDKVAQDWVVTFSYMQDCEYGDSAIPTTRTFNVQDLFTDWMEHAEYCPSNDQHLDSVAFSSNAGQVYFIEDSDCQDFEYLMEFIRNRLTSLSE